MQLGPLLPAQQLVRECRQGLGSTGTSQDTHSGFGSSETVLFKVIKLHILLREEITSNHVLKKTMVMLSLPGAWLPEERGFDASLVRSIRVLFIIKASNYSKAEIN